jgi:NAD(P)-dependent dehydrogenase (short-subunit alcohol dehydrogenase family)
MVADAATFWPSRHPRQQRRHVDQEGAGSYAVEEWQQVSNQFDRRPGLLSGGHPHMQRGGGRIISIGSMMSSSAPPMRLYSASKGAPSCN